MKFNLFFLFILSMAIFAGCNGKTGTPDAIYGTWRGVSWTVEGKDAGRDAASVMFQFDDQLQYTAAFGDQQEKGTFKVEGDKLYTTAEGLMQKMVKIVQLSPATFEMEMNRGGVRENLVLKKE